MAERVYTAEAIVLGKYGSGEASLSTLILTDRFGLVRVRAQSARSVKSKLRYALEPMTIGTYSFVRGARSNRLIGAQARERLLSLERLGARQAAGQIGRLLLRLMPGEHHDDGVFVIVEQGLRGLSNLPSEDIPAAECAIVLALLDKLGYLPEDPAPIAIQDELLSSETLARMKEFRADAVRRINRALQESGL